MDLIIRLTPTIRDNLAQNLDQQASKSSNNTPKPVPAESQDMYDKEYTKPARGAPQLPPLDIQRRNTDESIPSSLYSQPSRLEQYLKNDSLNPTTQNTKPAQQFQEARQQSVDSIKYNPPPQAQVQQPQPQPQPQPQHYNYQPPPTKYQDPAPAPENKQYGGYKGPPALQQYSPLPPQAPFAQGARPSSRPNSAQGRSQQQYPPPPIQADYSNQGPKPSKQPTYPQQPPPVDYSKQSPGKQPTYPLQQQPYPTQQSYPPQNQNRVSIGSNEPYWNPPQQAGQPGSRPPQSQQQPTARPPTQQPQQPRPMS